MQKLAMIALVVEDYDEAINWYRDALGFSLVQDEKLSEVKRWVVMRPGTGKGKGEGGADILLAKAASDEQRAAIGHQSGGRVFLFLYTDDFDGDYERMKANGVEFTETPRSEVYGKVVVFKDLYGNKWDFIERRG